MKLTVRVVQALAITALILFPTPSEILAASAPRNFALQPESPQFWNLVDHDAKLNGVRRGFRIHGRAGMGRLRILVCQR